jgi:lysyl-tRNA synthetase class 2
MANELGATEKELIKTRTEKLKKIEKLGLSGYPSESKKEYTNARVKEIYTEFIASGQEIFVAGRIIALRGHGKLVFADLEDESGKIQTVLKSDFLKADFDLIPLLDLGDIVEVSGKIILTKSEEISVEAKHIKLLTKSLRPLPQKHYGFSDEEERFRKRYLDLLSNPEIKEIFYQKAKFWNAVRKFMTDKGFLEVETPVLETTTGGADAEPFKTHLNTLDIDVFLRISMGELWQKRLLIGGFEKTFEIGRQFRNEGASREHLQDYTQMEFYWAYANYEDSMKLSQELYQYIAQEVFGTSKFKINGFDIDLAGEWKKIDYVKTVKDKLKIDVLKASDAELKKKIEELKLKTSKFLTRGRMIDTLWKSIRPTIAGPVFLINQPVEVSPLAKKTADNPKLVERYQAIIGGTELSNGYTELNDPTDQRERFLEQAKLREKGDREAQMNDEDFVEALEYGMPPATGFGMSERVFAVLSNRPVKECVMFPLVRPRNKK